MSKKSLQPKRPRRIDSPPGPAASIAAGSSVARESLLVPIALLVLLTLVTFGSVSSFDFLNWDDNIHVYQNAHLLAGLDGIGYFWTHPYQSLYVPLSYTAFGVLLAMARIGPGIQPISQTAPQFDPHVFHVANLALHVANVVGVFILLRRLTTATIPSALGAALFAVHPLQVESVAWISELRGLLGGLFSILSLNAYVAACQTAGEAVQRPRQGSYWLAVLLCICALLCKPSAATIGLVAVCLRVGFLKAKPMRAIIEATPFLLCAIPVTLISSSVQGSPYGQHTHIWQRPIIAGDALAFYLAKLFVPIRIAIDYGRKPTVVLGHWWGFVTWLLPAAVAALVVRFRRAFPAGAVVASIAVSFLLPVLGFIPFIYQGYSTVADRYMYLAMIGPALILAAALARTRSRRVRNSALGAAVCVIVVLAVMSWVHVRVWRSSLDLYKAAIAANPTSYAASTNLGAYYITTGEWTLAIPPLEQAVRNNPTDVFSIMDLGDAYRYVGNFAAATAAYEKGLALAPDDIHAHFGLGEMALRQRRSADAIRELSLAASSAAASGDAPTLIRAQGMLGDAYVQAKQFDQAVGAYQAATQIDPRSVYGWSGMGIANYLRKDYADAVTDFETALTYGPHAPALDRYLAQAKKLAGQAGPKPAATDPR